jgi:hypothetical protein
LTPGSSLRRRGNGAHLLAFSRVPATTVAFGPSGPRAPGSLRGAMTFSEFRL